MTVVQTQRPTHLLTQLLRVLCGAGTLTAAWFSGVKEEAPGCAIVFATLPVGVSQSYCLTVSLSSCVAVSLCLRRACGAEAYRLVDLLASKSPSAEDQQRRTLGGQRAIGGF